MSIIVLILLLTAGVGHAAGNDRSLSAARFDASPLIDGSIEDACWGEAPQAGDLIQFRPHHGEVSPLATTIRVGFDDRYLYVSFDCSDPDPGKISGALTKRDSPLNHDDAVFLLLDSFGDGYSATAFATNLLGTQWDFRITDNGRSIDSNWDESWQSAAALHDRGWSAEFAIPLRILKYHSGDDVTWGVNFGRSIPRTLEVSYWAGPVIQEYRVSQFGKLTGLQLATPAKRIEAIPYAMARETEGEKLKGEVGLDVRLRLSDALGADATINPDFATVEADAEQINLTRFELFIREKRPFFLEGTELYSQRVQQFYSRRIGDIPWGGKLNGKLAGVDLSLIVASSDPAETMDDTDAMGQDATYSVLRLKKGIFGSSNVGFLAANRDWRGDNQGSVGLDATLFFTRTTGLTSQIVRAHGLQNDGALSWFLRPSFDSAKSHFHLRYSNFDTGLMDNMNSVGFIRDDDRREFDTNVSHELWFKDQTMERVFGEINYNRYESQTGTLRSWQVDGELGCEFAEHWFLEVDREDVFKRYEEDFRNRETKFECGYDTRLGRSLEVSYATGLNENRDFQLIGAELGFKANDALKLEYGLTRLWLDPDPDGESTLIHMVRLDYYLNPNLFCKIFFQTNSAIDKENAQVSLVWRFMPPFGSLQLVYQHGTSATGTRSDQRHILFTKLSWVF